MSKERMFIRFGVHKDREVLKQLRDSFAGVVIPAHILAHSSDATRAAVDYIDRQYFIDPMTYIFTSENIASYITQNKKDDGIKFKMSIEKLTADYGLFELFQERNYEPLTPQDFTEEFIESLCTASKNFQCTKLNGQAESAYKKYADILAKVDPESFKLIDHQPIFIVPPYFYSGEIDDEWHKINLALAQKTRSLCDDKQQVAPVILTVAKNLTIDLLNSYADFDRLIIWITDLDESKASTDQEQVKRLRQLREFVEAATEKDKEVTNLYGSYYSALLTKLGLKAFCNGIFYGEYKDYRSKVGGGAPPARFYISALHRFYLVPVALSILQDDPALFDLEPDASKNMLGHSYEQIAGMLTDQTLAQKHFLYAREQELTQIHSKDLAALLDDLGSNFNEHGAYDDSIQKEKPKQLLAWGEAFQDETESK